MRGAVIGKVVGSKSARYPVGSYVYAPSGWTELAVFDDSNKDMVMVELPKDGKLTDTLGVLGLFACFLCVSQSLLISRRKKWNEIVNISQE